MRFRNVGKVHAPAGNEHAEHSDFTVDAVGALVLRVGVGSDGEIAERAVIDAAARDEPIGLKKRRWRVALGRPVDGTSRHRLR